MRKQRKNSLKNDPAEPKIVHLRSVTSTNDHARLLAGEGAPQGTMVRADTQTQGRGRSGRRWSSPRGGLWMSVILRPAPNVGLSLIPAFCALAVAKVLRKRGIPAGVEWPNDVTVNGRKIAGILCDAEIQNEMSRWIIAGVGLNVNNPPPSLASDPSTRIATSMLEVTGKRSSLGILSRELREQILRTLEELNAGLQDSLLANYNALLLTRGRRLRVDLEGRILSGTGGEMDMDGRLLIRSGGRRFERLSAEDVIRLELV